MKEFPFAAMLEGSIRQQIEQLGEQVPSELLPVLELVGKFQAEFELLLDRAQYTNVDTGAYPAVDAVALLGPDAAWQKVSQNFAAYRDKNIAALCVLWSLHAMTERSGQYYHQAALNSAHPATRLVLASLGEIKAMLRRRIEGLIRVMYNEIWGGLGFAPFMLGKD